MANQQAQSLPDCRLYLITPAQIAAADIDAFAATLDEALAAGDVACLQIRLKNADDVAAPDALIEQLVRAVLPLAHARDVAVLINDRPDLAKALGCDGVHIGQQDTPYAAARKILGADAIIGVTCHDSRHLAMQAGEAGADYVAFGAFYPTQTKSPKARARPELLRLWSESMEVPCVAIGGITVDNCAPLVAAGAEFLAVSAGVWNHPDGPAAAIRAFNRTISETLAKP